MAEPVRVTTWSFSTQAGSEAIAGQVGTAAAALSRLDPEIILLQGVKDWGMCRQLAEEPTAPPGLKVAWTGQNAVSKASNNSVRLFITTWTNLIPSAEIESLDYVSSMAGPAPFLIAISVD